MAATLRVLIQVSWGLKEDMIKTETQAGTQRSQISLPSMVIETKTQARPQQHNHPFLFMDHFTSTRSLSRGFQSQSKLSLIDELPLPSLSISLHFVLILNFLSLIFFFARNFLLPQISNKLCLARSKGKFHRIFQLCAWFRVSKLKCMVQRVLGIN